MKRTNPMTGRRVLVCGKIGKKIFPKTRVKCIGNGGFGCVLAPALLYKRRFITPDSHRDYVSKILKKNDAIREYKLSKEICKLINHENVGIFPIDSLEDFNIEKISNKKYFLKNCKQLTRYKHGVSVLKDLKCIQYKRFKSDFWRHSEYLAANPDITENLFEQLTKKLQILHSKNIVHMDIMNENLAYISDTEASIFDFGLAHVLNCPSNIRKLVREFKDRRDRLFDEYLHVEDTPIGDKLEAYFQKYKNDDEKMVKYFKCIDCLMLIASKCDIYGDDNTVQCIEHINTYLLQ